MKKGQGPLRTLPLPGASSSMGSVLTANRQSGVSVIVVHGHRLGSFTEVGSRSQRNSAPDFLTSQLLPPEPRTSNTRLLTGAKVFC